MVLSSQRVPLGDALYSVKQKTAAEAANPLVYDGQKLIPSVTRVFSRSRDLYVFLQAYQRGATATQPLVAFVSFYRGDVKAFETAPLAVTDGLDARTKAVPLRFSLPLESLATGRYDCQVTVIDADGAEDRVLARADRHRAVARPRPARTRRCTSGPCRNQFASRTSIFSPIERVLERLEALRDRQPAGGPFRRRARVRQPRRQHLVVVVRVDDLRRDGLHALRGGGRRHAAERHVQRDERDVDVLQRAHFGHALGDAGDVDPRAAERDHVAVGLALRDAPARPG